MAYKEDEGGDLTMTKDNDATSIFTKKPLDNGKGLYSEYETLTVDKFNNLSTDENGKAVPQGDYEECPEEEMNAYLDSLGNDSLGG